MLDHIGFTVSDYEAAKAFYRAALGPLGISLLHEYRPEAQPSDAYAGFGHAERAFFWIAAGDALKGSLHVAFTAKNRASVDAFHAAAIGAGARDNGKPGLRPEYHADYYGAFVLDADGHNIEAVCHLAEPGSS